VWCGVTMDTLGMFACEPKIGHEDIGDRHR